MPTTQEQPLVLVMDKVLALRLGASQIPFNGNVPEALQPSRPTIIVQAGPKGRKTSWMYWEIVNDEQILEA